MTTADPRPRSSPSTRRLTVFDLEPVRDAVPEGSHAFEASGGMPGRRLFGGQVAAQAFLAAARTLDPASGQGVHSLHGYFLRPGRGGVPIRYTVHPLKDGRNFSARDVVAAQGEEVIFSLHVSFARPEPGIAHQEGSMPEAPPPESLDEQSALEAPLLAGLPEALRKQWSDGPVQVRTCDPDTWDGTPQTSLRRLWIRPRVELPADPVLHAAALIWVSDRSLIRTGARPHALSGHYRRSASLDHCMWFHREAPFDDWWLYTMESPVAHAARAFIQGAMYRRDGTRMLTVAQEGLIRS